MKNKKPIIYGLIGAGVAYLLLLLATVALGSSAEIIIRSPIEIRPKVISPTVRSELERKILEAELRRQIEEELKNSKETSLEPAREVFGAEKGNDTIEEKIRAVFGKDGDMAVKVAFCESSLNPLVTHKTSSAKGLFQIIDPTWKHFDCVGSPFNPDDNIRCAKKIFDKCGWDSTASWLASRRCWEGK